MEKFVPVDLNKCRVMSRDEVRAFDRWAIDTVGIPGVVLMENAGRGCACVIEQMLCGSSGKKICIFCGTGNNGGDGFVIGRHLFNRGADVKFVLCGPRDKVKGDALINLEIIEKMGIGIEILQAGAEGTVERVEAAACDSDLIVDALFGTGLRGELDAGWTLLIESINKAGKPIVSVDIPSGLDCDSGHVLGASVTAKVTVTFAAVKKGFCANQAHRYTGEIFTASIGIEPDNFAAN